MKTTNVYSCKITTGMFNGLLYYLRYRRKNKLIGSIATPKIAGAFEGEEDTYPNRHY